MAKHAFLAASASERWLHCPPSAKLCAQEDDLGSEYARQGSDAHALCEHLLLKALGRETRDPTEDLTYLRRFHLAVCRLPGQQQVVLRASANNEQ